MSRITACFEDVVAQQKKTLLGFMTAGVPDLTTTVDLMHQLVDAGVNVIELGIPFSDPMADGPIIQRSSEYALSKGVNLNSVLELVAQFRIQDTKTPVVLMSYLNPIEVKGYNSFAKQAHVAGADGVIVVDLPPEEASEMNQALHQNHLDHIFLLAPNTSHERIEKIIQLASGFLYYVALKGVTGGDGIDFDTMQGNINAIHAKTRLPVAIGFGIKTPEMARQFGQLGDGVIVGSALVDCILKYESSEALKTKVYNLMSSFRNILDR